ncbi:MAG: glycosyltransferase [Chthoniobacterales bacterium]
MNIQRKPVIVVLGMISTMPVGGVIWQTLHYLIGLQRLGFDVFYAEDHGMPAAMFADEVDPDGSARAADFLARILGRFDLDARWSYHAWSGEERYYGIAKREIERAYDRAAAVINLHGGTVPRAKHKRGGAFIYLETDPVAPEVELYNGVTKTEEFLDQHTAHFTFGENLGSPDSKVPVPVKYRFHPTRQPILCDLWRDHNFAPREPFTTIANWRQPVREMTLDGETYSWSKHWEFMKFLDLPKRTEQSFELALSSYEETDRDMLQAHGWRVVRALEFSRDMDTYREYICSSRGEWTVAKDQNVRLRSGWFSDRAATYLAAGRPVVTQETGFSNVLPTGTGLFAFSTMEEVVSAIREINSDYRRHSRRAAEIAREYFDAEMILSKLLREAGVELPRRAPEAVTT